MPYYTIPYTLTGAIKIWAQDKKEALEKFKNEEITTDRDLLDGIERSYGRIDGDAITILEENIEEE